MELVAGGETPIAFQHRFESAGRREVSVRLSDDALVADNTHTRVLRVYDRVRVLCVGGAPGATRYVADALNPTGDRDAPIVATRIADADLRTVDLDAYACVFCCNVSEFAPIEAERLERFVGGGGGLVFFLGDRVNAAAYNRVLGPGDDGPLSRLPTSGVFRLAAYPDSEPAARVGVDPGGEPLAPASPLLPVALGDAVSEATYQIDPLEYEHPIVAPFRGRQRAGLLTTPVMRRHPIRLFGEPDRAKVALAIGGSPLMITADHGRGRVALVGTAASVDSIDPSTGGPWTAWPAWPSFLPIVRGLLEYTAGATADEPTRLVGDVLTGGADGEAPPQVRRPDGAVVTGGADGEAPPQVRRPDGAVEPATPHSSGGWTYDVTDAPGVYRVERVGAGVGADAVGYAVNTSDAESSLRPVDRGALPNVLEVVAGGAAGAASTAAASTPLHRLLLYAAIGLALLDTALAAWFGRGAA